MRASAVHEFGRLAPLLAWLAACEPTDAVSEPGRAPTVQRVSAVSAPSNLPSTRTAGETTSWLDALLPEARQRVHEAPFPVLLFGDRALLERAQVMRGDRWLAVAVRDGERSLSLHLTDVVHHDLAHEPRTARPAHVRGRPASFTTNEGIRSVAWEEDGVEVSLDVECARPESDLACVEDGYLRGLVEALVHVGGVR